MDRNEIVAKVTALLVGHLGVETEAVQTETLLVPDHDAQGVKLLTDKPDLGCDSLDIVEVVMALEDEFTIEIPDDVAEPLNQVRGRRRSRAWCHRAESDDRRRWRTGNSSGGKSGRMREGGPTMNDLPPPLSNIDNVPLEEVAAEEARLVLAPLDQRRADLLKALDNVTVADEEDMRRVADKIALAAACREAADERIAPILRPYAASSGAVRNVAANFCGALKGRETAAQTAINAFRKRQREAAAKARNEQLEREALLRANAGLAPDPAAPVEVKASDVRLESVRGDYRTQVFDRAVVVVKIIDPRALPDLILKSPAVTEALEKAVRQMAKMTKDIPGAEVTDDRASSVKVG